MICVSEAAILAKAAKMPVAYLSDCKKAAQIKQGNWCFTHQDFNRIRRTYRGYAVSEADRFREGEIISGCCDRADQY